MADRVVDYAKEAQGHRRGGSLLHHGTEGPPLQVPGGVQEDQGTRRRPRLRHRPPREAKDLRTRSPFRQELRRPSPRPQVHLSPSLYSSMCARALIPVSLSNNWILFITLFSVGLLELRIRKSC